MNTHDWHVYIVEEFVMEFDGEAGIEEDHDLLFTVLLQECEEQKEALVRRANNITLKTKHF